MAQVNTRITVVRMAVARFESTPDTPTLASKAVAAANTAESNAQKTQVIVLAYAREGIRRESYSHSLQCRKLKSRLLQVDILPLAAFDSRTDLLRSLPSFGLLVGINSFLHAGGTGRS